MKYISGIGKKPFNIANLSEFGRYPFSIKVLIKTCKYLKRLLTTYSELLLCGYKEGSTMLVVINEPGLLR